MRHLKRFCLICVVGIFAGCPLGGCAWLGPSSDTSLNAVQGGQSILQPDGYRDIWSGDEPSMNTDSFMGGFSGSP